MLLVYFLLLCLTVTTFLLFTWRHKLRTVVTPKHTQKATLELTNPPSNATTTPHASAHALPETTSESTNPPSNAATTPHVLVHTLPEAALKPTDLHSHTTTTPHALEHALPEATSKSTNPLNNAATTSHVKTYTLDIARMWTEPRINHLLLNRKKTLPKKTPLCLAFSFSYLIFITTQLFAQNRQQSTFHNQYNKTPPLCHINETLQDIDDLEYTLPSRPSYYQVNDDALLIHFCDHYNKLFQLKQRIDEQEPACHSQEFLQAQAHILNKKKAWSQRINDYIDTLQKPISVQDKKMPYRLSYLQWIAEALITTEDTRGYYSIDYPGPVKPIGSFCWFYSPDGLCAALINEILQHIDDLEYTLLPFNQINDDAQLNHFCNHYNRLFELKQRIDEQKPTCHPQQILQVQAHILDKKKEWSQRINEHIDTLEKPTSVQARKTRGKLRRETNRFWHPDKPLEQSCSAFTNNAR